MVAEHNIEIKNNTKYGYFEIKYNVHKCCIIAR